MNTIKYEIEVLQNPKMRKDFVELKLNKMVESSTNCYLVMQQGNLDGQIKFLQAAKKVIGQKNDVWNCSSLQEALNISNYSDIIYVPPREHVIKFLESFNSGGSMKCIPTDGESNQSAVISAKQQEPTLLTVDGDFSLENITLDCSNVSTGLLIRSGRVTRKNYVILDRTKSPAKQGIKITGGNVIVQLINTKISTFSVGISLKGSAVLQMQNNSVISDCEVGIASTDLSKLELCNSSIKNCNSRGIYFETSSVPNLETKKKMVINEISELNEKHREFLKFGDNVVFANNRYGNLVIVAKMVSNSYMNENAVVKGIRRSILDCNNDDDDDDELVTDEEMDESCDDFCGFTDAVDNNEVIILNDSIDQVN